MTHYSFCNFDPHNKEFTKLFICENSGMCTMGCLHKVPHRKSAFCYDECSEGRPSCQPIKQNNC